MAEPTKTKKPKAPPKPKPIYIALHILGEDGQPMSFPKERVRLIKASKDAGAILDATTGDSNVIVQKLMGDFFR